MRNATPLVRISNMVLPKGSNGKFLRGVKTEHSLAPPVHRAKRKKEKSITDYWETRRILLHKWLLLHRICLARLNTLSLSLSEPIFFFFSGIGFYFHFPRFIWSVKGIWLCNFHGLRFFLGKWDCRKLYAVAVGLNLFIGSCVTVYASWGKAFEC